VRRRIGKGQPLKDPDRLVANIKTAPAEEVASLAADQAKGNLVLLSLFDDELTGGFDDVRVEAAAQSTVGRDDDEERSRTGRCRDAQQRMCLLLDTRDETVQHFQHALRERPCRDDAFLRAPQTRRRDHLHRLGDLLRRLDGADPAAEVNE
jgi:hypothetical protein